MNPCAIDNGGCSHHCLSRPSSTVPGQLEASCVCPTGHRMNSDGKTCNHGKTPLSLLIARFLFLSLPFPLSHSLTLSLSLSSRFLIIPFHHYFCISSHTHTHTLRTSLQSSMPTSCFPLVSIFARSHWTRVTNISSIST